MSGESEVNMLLKEKDRCITLAVSICAMVCAGTVYGFGAINATMKEAIGADESQMGVISLMGNLGLWCGSASGGFALDRFGPKPVMLAGGVLQFVAYVLLSVGLGTSENAQWMSPSACAVLWLICGLGCGALFNASMFTNARNFAPRSRGIVIGIMSTFFGLSPTLCVSVLQACVGGRYKTDNTCEGGFANNNLTLYSMFLAVVVFLAAGASTLLSKQLSAVDVSKIEFDSSVTVKRLWPVVRLAFILWFFVTFSSLVQVVPSVAATLKLGMWTPFGSLFLLGLICFVQCRSARGSTAGAEPIVEVVGDTGTVPDAPPSLSPVAAFRTQDFWLLWVTMTCVVGTNVATMNITSTIVLARQISLPGLSDDPKQLGDMMQVVCNSSSALFRFLLGLTFYFRPNLPKTAPLVVAGIGSCLCQILYGTGVDGLALLAALVGGVSDGIVWAAAPMVSSTLFGLKHTGSIFGCVVAFSSVGVLFMGSFVEPKVYNSHIVPGADECFGTECFAEFHAVGAGVAFIGTAAATTLLLLQRRKQSHELSLQAKCSASQT